MPLYLRETNYSGGTNLGTTLNYGQLDGNFIYLDEKFKTGPFTGSLSGSLQGTASYATTASFVVTAQTASFITSSNVVGPFGVNSILSASYSSGSTSASYALSSSYALTASYYGGTVSAFPFTGSAVITGSLIVTGSIQTNNNSYADVANYARSFQPYNGGYGKLPLNPVNPNVTASAAISWWASNQGASVASFGPGAIDVVYYCDQNLGQIGLYNQSNFQNWAGSIKFINNNLTTDISNGKVPYHVLITDNATLTDNQASISTLEANGRRHILGVTGSFLVMGGATIGNNIADQHYITGSVLSTGSFTQNGFAILTQVSRSLNFADDAAAAAGGVPLGGLYRNGNAIQIRLA
jgi:hypothetical protein